VLFGCTFHKGQMYIFDINMKRRIFHTPFDLFKEKSFHLINQCVLFMNKKVPTWKQPHNISESGFLLTDLRFSAPFQHFKPHIWAPLFPLLWIRIGNISFRIIGKYNCKNVVANANAPYLARDKRMNAPVFRHKIH
jgi:hypothetical protein